MLDYQKYLEETTNKVGCYLFKNSSGNVIYVGKAKNIQKRIRQHFQNAYKSIKAVSMIKEIDEWETFVTDNEKEAFILEHNLIKKHYPKFNIILVDDQTYPYIFISKENKDPKYFLVWKKVKQAGIYYGPFPDRYSGKEVLNLLETLFPLRRCLKPFRKKPCFYYNLGQCSGACFQDVPVSYYQKQIEKVKMFFRGKVKQIKTSYLKKINNAIKNMQFEQAQRWQNLVNKIDHFVEKQNVEFNNYANWDFMNFIAQKQEILIVIFFYRQGKLQLKKEGLFSLFNNSVQETIENFLQEIYTYHPLPQELIIPNQIDLNNWAEVYQVKLTCPKKGRKKEVLELVKKNAQKLLDNQVVESSEESRIAILNNLSQVLNLRKNKLTTIEFLDLSYFDQKLTVAGFSHYLNGAPLFKKNKIYQIESSQHNEKEYFKNAIIKHYQKHNLPELIILDGGILQLQGAKEGFASLQKNTQIIALVKNKKHQTEYALNQQGQRIKIDLKSKTGLFLSRIQAEGHLYVIKNFHLLRRRKNKLL